MSEQIIAIPDEFRKLPYDGASDDKVIWIFEWSKLMREAEDRNRWSGIDPKHWGPFDDFIKVFVLPCLWLRHAGDYASTRPKQCKLVHIWWLRRHAAVLLELILQGVAKRTYHLQLKDHVFRSISIAAPTPGMEPSDVAGWGPNDGSWARMKFRCIPTFDLSNSDYASIARTFNAQSNKFAAGRAQLWVKSRGILKTGYEGLNLCPPMRCFSGTVPDARASDVMYSYRNTFPPYHGTEPMIIAMSYFVILDRDWFSKGAIICQVSTLESRRCEITALPQNLIALEMDVLSLHALQAEYAPGEVLKIESTRTGQRHRPEAKLTLAMLEAEETHYYAQYKPKQITAQPDKITLASLEVQLANE